MESIGASFSKKYINVLRNLWLKQAFKRLRDVLTNEDDINEAFKVIRPEVEIRINNQVTKLSTSTLRTTQKNINTAIAKTRAALAQELVYGENTIPGLTKAVRGVFEDAEKYRAKRIAITESSLAVHDADILAAKESRVIRGFAPVVSADACPLCQVYNEDKKPTGIPLYPYTSVNSAVRQIGVYEERTLPPFHPNCRCTQRAILVTDTTKYPEEIREQPSDEEREVAVNTGIEIFDNNAERSVRE